MNPELERIATRMKEAQTPEDVFGVAAGADCLPAIRKSYHALARKVHPDLFSEDEEKLLAHATFAQLLEWFRQAEEKVLFGVYGHATQIILQTRQRDYCIDDSPSEHGIFNVYPCRFSEDGKLHLATLKLVREPRHNNLAQNEIIALRKLHAAPDAAKFSAYLPRLLDAFIYDDAGNQHQASVFEHYPGWYSFEDVRCTYPDGIDPKDMAWMFRRVLTALGFAHRNGVIHGALTPQNVLILPEDHGLMLTGWHCAVSDPAFPVLDPGCGARYPDDVLKGKPLSFGTDIVMAVKCMIFLSGGDVHLLPKSLQAFFKGSSLPGKRAPQDAWALLKEFDELIGRLWGRRTFRPFLMK